MTHLHGELTTMLCDNCFRKFSIGPAPIAPTLVCPRCGDVEPVKLGIVFFGETSPGYHILTEELERLRAEDILLIIGTSLRVIPVDMLVPSWRASDELVWQVNPELVDQRYYGRNVCATAADGLAQLKPLQQRMAS